MNKYINIVIVLILVVLGVWLFTNGKSDEGNIINSNNQSDKIMKATLHTNQGDIAIEFFDKQAPNTVANFTK
ncbi:MAG: peptidylprolyl isomerase, partial [bacterium]